MSAVELRSLLAQASRLKNISDSPVLDTELLLAQALGKPRSWLYSHPEAPVDAATQSTFRGLIKRRQQGYPVAWLLGYRDFWTLRLHSDSRALVPRPETELLVELSLQMVTQEEQVTVLDLGTGSGALALAVASERPGWQVTGIDISADALALAEHNRQLLQLDNIRWLESDWFSALEPKPFHLILANPPYINENDPVLQQPPLCHEPPQALASGPEGLNALRTICFEAREFLHPHGLLLLEHGYNQRAAVRRYLAAAGFTSILCHDDMAGLPRVITAVNPPDRQ